MDNEISKEANTELNLFIISDDYDEKEFPIIDKNKQLMKNWKIIRGKKEEIETIFKNYKEMLNDYKTKKEKIMNDVFILQVNNSKDKLIIQLIKNLDKLINRSETYLIPFIIFLVKEETPEDIIINNLEKNGGNEEEEEEKEDDDDQIDFSKFEQKKFLHFLLK